MRVLEAGSADLLPLGEPSLPGRGRRLRRLLLVARARHEPRAAVPAGRRAAAAQLAAPADRLPRPRRLDRRLRHADRAAVGAAAGVRADRGARHRARARVRDGAGQAARRADRGLRGAGSRVRLRAGQRLERARPAALGVPAAGPVPRQVVRDLDLALDRADGGARAVSRAGAPQDPEPLPYLRCPGDWAFDVELSVELNGEVISRTNARGLYWTFPQQLAHATVNGAAVRPGDLFASGTISGPTPGSEGSLIELGRPFLADGDTVVLRGAAGNVSFGEVSRDDRQPRRRETHHCRTNTTHDQARS